jgi:hypothetical protein
MRTLKQILGSAAFLGALAFGGLNAKAEESPAPIPPATQEKSRLFELSFEQTNLSGGKSQDNIFPSGTDVDTKQFDNSTTATGSRYSVGMGVDKNWNFNAGAGAGYLTSQDTLNGVSPADKFDSSETRFKLKWYPTSSGWFMGPFYSERNSSISGNAEEEPSSTFVVDPYGNIVLAVNTEYETKVEQDRQIFGISTGYDGELYKFNRKWSLRGGLEASLGKCTTTSKVKKSWHNDAEGTSGSEDYTNETSEYLLGAGAGINLNWTPTKNTRVSLGYCAEYQNWGGDREADMQETTFMQVLTAGFTWLF